MKEIETVLDLLTFIDQQKKKGVIDFNSPVKIHRNNVLFSPNMVVIRQSKRNVVDVVKSGGIKVLAIE